MQILGLFLAGLAAGPVCPMVQATNLPFIAEVPVAPRDGGTIANARADKPVIVKVYCESTREACEEDLKRHVERAIHGPARLMSTAVERMRANPMPRVVFPSERANAQVDAIQGIHQAVRDDAKSMKTLAEQARVGPVQAKEELVFEIELLVDGKSVTRKAASIDDLAEYVGIQMHRQRAVAVQKVVAQKTGRIESLWVSVSIGAQPVRPQPVRAKLWYLGLNRRTTFTEELVARLTLGHLGIQVESTTPTGAAGTTFEVRCRGS